MITKMCIRCSIEKPLEQFRTQNCRPNGKGSHCKECVAKDGVIYRAQNRERINETNKAWSKTDSGLASHRAANVAYSRRNFKVKSKKEYDARRLNVIPYMLYTARHKAKKRGMEFNIDESDLSIPAFCPVLGIPLRIGEGKLTQNSPSLDRIDNKRGYVKGNVVIVSMRANAIKNDATVDELHRVYEFYARITSEGKPAPERPIVPITKIHDELLF